MPVDKQTVRPYESAEDPANPAATPPHWSVIAGMLITVLAAGVTSLLGVYDTLRTDPLKAALITAAAMLASAGTVIGVAVMQGRKELASVQGAKDIRLAETTGEVEVDRIEAQAEAAVPPPKDSRPAVGP